MTLSTEVPLVKSRLSFMMFLQYAIWGAWLPLLWPYLSGHLGFARGPHCCIGSHFARLQARIAVEELYAAHPTVGVDRDSAIRALSPFTRGFVSLPATGLA